MDNNASNLTDILKEYDKDIALAKEAILLGDALNRLKQNEDFKLIVENAYIADQQKEVVNKLLDPLVDYPMHLPGVEETLLAVNNLKRFIGTPTFIGTLQQTANLAIDQIELLEQQKQFTIENGGK